MWSKYWPKQLPLSMLLLLLLLYPMTLGIIPIHGSIVAQSSTNWFNDNENEIALIVGQQQQQIPRTTTRTTIQMAKYIQQHHANVAETNSLFQPLIVSTTPITTIQRRRSSSIGQQTNKLVVKGSEEADETKAITVDDSDSDGPKESTATSHFHYHLGRGEEDLNGLNRNNYANQKPIDIKTTPTTNNSANLNVTTTIQEKIVAAQKFSEIGPKPPMTSMTDAAVYTLTRVYKHFTTFMANLLLSANLNANDTFSSSSGMNLMPNLSIIFIHLLMEQAPKYLNDFTQQIRNVYGNCLSNVDKRRHQDNMVNTITKENSDLTRRTYSSISLTESLANTFEAAENTMALAFDEGRHKSKNKHLQRLLLPLLLAYKLKFLTMIPLLVAGLTLLVGTSGMAGFFFALFTAVMTLRLGGGAGTKSVVVKDL